MISSKCCRANGPEVYSASDWIEYQGYLFGRGEVKAADACSWQSNHLYVRNIQKIWKPQPPEAFTACPGLWRIAWTLLVWHTALMFIDKILLPSCQFFTFHDFTQPCSSETRVPTCLNIRCHSPENNNMSRYCRNKKFHILLKLCSYLFSRYSL